MARFDSIFLYFKWKSRAKSKRSKNVRTHKQHHDGGIMMMMMEQSKRQLERKEKARKSVVGCWVSLRRDDDGKRNGIRNGKCALNFLYFSFLLADSDSLIHSCTLESRAAISWICSVARGKFALCALIIKRIRINGKWSFFLLLRQFSRPFQHVFDFVQFQQHNWKVSH